MEKPSIENKKLFLLADFNVNLIENGVHIESMNFFDILQFFLVPYIILPTRFTATNRSTIDNIFSNSVTEGISGNFTVPISDHLAQFLAIPDGYEPIHVKHEIYKGDTKNGDRKFYFGYVRN